MDSQNNRMKRELIGLVLGTGLVLSGSLFLFNHFMWQENYVTITTTTPPPTTETASVAVAEPTPAPVADSLQDKPVDKPASTEILPVTEEPVSLQTASVETEPEPSPTEASSERDTDSTLPEAEETAAPEPIAPPPTKDSAPPQHSGWIYGGKFVNGKWVEQGLKTGDALPVSGERYTTNWEVAVRDNPPGKRYNNGEKMGKIITYFRENREVTVLQVKPSGNQGHIWLEVGW